MLTDRLRIASPRPGCGLCRGLLGVFLLALAVTGQALESVTLQLKWSHAFQFAGYYAALEQGFYREAGLDVRIVEAKPGVDVVATVLAGQADFGVGTSGLLVERARGKPVVALAVIFQHSPLVFIARKGDGTQSIHDLLGKRVMIEPNSEELLAYLAQEKIPPGSFQQLEHSFNPQDLISGKVDVISAYISNETYHLQQANLPYQIFTPRSAGIDFYGDNLFTSEAQIREHPERVRAFREATLRGWRYAMANREEIAPLIYRKYSQQHPLSFYLYEAEAMVPLIRADLVEIGYMNPGRWRHIAEVYAERGMLPRDFDFGGFLYDPEPQRGLSRVHAYLAAALLGLALLAAVVGYIYRINRRLQRSVAESVEAKALLAESEAQFRALAENTAAGMYVVHDARLLMANPAMSTITGYARQELLSMDYPTLFHPDCRRQVLEWASAAQRGDATTRRDEVKLLTRRGEVRWLDLTAAAIAFHGKAACMVTAFDITSRRTTEARIAHLAQYDSLTDLPNRSLFGDRLHQAIALARRNQERLAMLYLDLDHFKPINDNHGHAVGDLLLQEAARRMQAAVRASDTVGRIGGDEFVVLLPRVEAVVDAERVAEKIRLALEAPFMVGELRLCVSVSIGIAVFPEHGGDELELAKNADLAMYRAKNDGRNALRVYRPEDARSAFAGQ